MKCPCCGRSMPTRETRFGVQFTSLRARIVEIVQRAGPDGIHKDDLMDIIYGSMAKRRSFYTLYSAICKINIQLEGTGNRIRGHSGWHTYRMVSDVKSEMAA